MKKILFMIPDLGQGGAEKVLINLVNNMDKTKFKITVITLFGGGINEQFLAPHINFRSVFKKSFPGNCKIFSMFSPKFLYKCFVKEKYDIEVSYLEGVTARIIGGSTNPNSKKVAWIHVEQHSTNVATYAFKNRAEAEKIYNSYDKIISVSKTVSEDFNSILNLKAPPEVLYNTVESNVILEKSKEPLETKFNDDEINLIAVATLKPIKGYPRLINIHKKLIDKGLKVHTYILGTGPDEGALKNQAKDLGVSETVTLLGYNTNPYKYVARADLFVCPSYAEGFSTSATESLIVGTPVCTTLVSGMKEMLGENNEYGIITENDEDALFDGICKMLTQPETLKHYKAMAKERGETFSTEATVKATENMLLNL